MGGHVPAVHRDLAGGLRGHADPELRDEHVLPTADLRTASQGEWRKARPMAPGPRDLPGNPSRSGTRSGRCPRSGTRRPTRMHRSSISPRRWRQSYRPSGPGCPGRFSSRSRCWCTRSPRGDVPELRRAYQRLASALPAATKIVWTYFGDVALAWPLLSRLPVDVVGFDLFESSLEAGEKIPGRGSASGASTPEGPFQRRPGRSHGSSGRPFDRWPRRRCGWARVRRSTCFRSRPLRRSSSCCRRCEAELAR